MPIVFDYTPPKINAAAAMAAAKEGAVEAGAKVLLNASQPLVPRDTGQMQRSGQVVTVAPGVAAVTYTREGEDGYNVAARQHEDYTLNHPNGGQADYLGQPMHTEGAEVLAAMAEIVRASVGL